MRLGLVLGAGGSTGHGFHCGALAALADVCGLDAVGVDLIVGTSAGSSVGALVRAGLGGPDLAARACGDPPSPRLSALIDRIGPPLRRALTPPTPPARGPASIRGLMTAGLRPWDARVGAVAAAALPPGSVAENPVARSMRAVFADGWPDAALWVCAVRVDDGRRVVFRPDGEPAADVASAVSASCAIPGWFAPVTIGGARYVDGGAWSPTNADVAADAGLDAVIVTSPMSAPPAVASRLLDGPARMLHAGYLRAEVARLRRRGAAVMVIEPTAADLEVMGRNPMDASRLAAVTRQVRASVAERLTHGDLARRRARVGLA
jgi:NTE family protein